jgi:hypothetical protein
VRIMETAIRGEARPEFYTKLRAAFVNYLTTVLRNRFDPQMVEDLLALVQTCEKGDCDSRHGFDRNGVVYIE